MLVFFTLIQNRIHHPGSYSPVKKKKAQHLSFLSRPLYIPDILGIVLLETLRLQIAWAYHLFA